MENGCHSIRINGVWEFSRCGELNFFARLGNALSRLRHAGRMPALQNKFRRSSTRWFPQDAQIRPGCREQDLVRWPFRGAGVYLLYRPSKELSRGIPRSVTSSCLCKKSEG